MNQERIKKHNERVRKHGFTSKEKKESEARKKYDSARDWAYIEEVFLFKIMLSFLLPLAYKVVDAAVAKIPDDAELGDKLIDLCLLIVGKAVKLTKTTADDELFAKVEAAIRNREDAWLINNSKKIVHWV